MGIADVQTAFIEAAKGKFTCTAARMRYDTLDPAQILEFDVVHLPDGRTLQIVHRCAANADLMVEARRAAADAIVEASRHLHSMMQRAT